MDRGGIGLELTSSAATGVTSERKCGISCGVSEKIFT